MCGSGAVFAVLLAAACSSGGPGATGMEGAGAPVTSEQRSGHRAAEENSGGATGGSAAVGTGAGGVGGASSARDAALSDSSRELADAAADTALETAADAGVPAEESLPAEVADRPVPHFPEGCPSGADPPADATGRYAGPCLVERVSADNPLVIYGYRYDARGNVVCELQDGENWGKEPPWTADGVPNTITLREYDDHDNLVRSARVAADGGTTWSEPTVYRYDGQGRLTRAELPGGTVTTYAYDADGRLDREMTLLFDGGESFRSYSYDAQGRLSEERSQYRLEPLKVVTFVYDANGNLSAREYDNDGDGVIDLREKLTRDASGFVVRFDRFARPPNEADFAPEPVATENYKNDGDGNLRYRTSNIDSLYRFPMGSAERFYHYRCDR